MRKQFNLHRSRLIHISLLIFLLLTLSLPGGNASAAGVLISQGKPVTASSTENAAFPAVNAVDGNTGTRWASAFSDPQWIQIDLGATASIDRVVLNWEAAYGRSYQIQISTNGSTWTTIYSTTTGNGGTDDLAITGSGRYVRMNGTARATQYGYSLWEFQVYGTFASSTNLALGRPATSSSNEAAGTTPNLAVDGNLTSRWSSGFSDPQWIQIDLGSTQTIGRVVLRWEAAYGRSYQIQTSGNGTSWTTVYSTTTGDGGSDDLTVSGSGRYIRMYGTARATPYGYSLFEFEVYGGSGGPTATTPPPGPTATPTRTPTPTRTNTPPSGSVLLSYNKPAVASTSQNNANCSGCTTDKAVDLLNSTRWASDAWDDNQWIYVDLGASATVTRVILRWEAAYGRGYQIQVSSNATSWATIYTTSTGDGGIDDITGLNASGRYVRMNGTARGTAWGWSLWEFEIYGTGGAPNPTPITPPTATPHGSNWTLVWSDEFNGASLDGSNWTSEVNGSGMGNNELEYYTNGQNLSFENGALVITARQENPANYQCWYGTCTYTSGRINTQGKRQFTYGRIEARIRVPYGQGIWPAFWMLGNDIGTAGWPSCGEIDIMENIGREPNIVHGTVHGPGYSGAAGIGGPYTLPSGKFSDAYHVFAVEWENNVFRWYVDGNLYFTLNRSTVESRGQWVFDHPHFIILNLAVGGAWPGNPDGTTVFPQRMYIDYVRVYQ